MAHTCTLSEEEAEIIRILNPEAHHPASLACFHKQQVRERVQITEQDPVIEIQT